MDHIIITYWSETFQEMLSSVIPDYMRDEYNTRKDYQELYIGTRDQCWTIYTNSMNKNGSLSIGYHTTDRTIQPSCGYQSIISYVY